MTHQTHFILNVLRSLQSRTEAAAKLRPGLRHMLVLPPGESIRVPPRSGCHPVGFSSRRQQHPTCKFGETELVGLLPPHTSWPKGIKPLRAVVAEQSFHPYRPLAREPYRIHLFFGGSDGTFEDLQALADDLEGIRGDLTHALFGDHVSSSDSVFYTAGDCLHDEGAARLDSWLCTVHWWAWVWTECPFRTRPQVVYAGSTHEADPLDDAVASKLAFSMFDADVLTASAATLSLILRFFDEPPALFWRADYPDVPKADEMLPADVASLAERFSRYVMNFLEWEKICNLPVATAYPTAPGSPTEAEMLNRPNDASERKHEAAARIRRYGRVLAAALERYGCNSAGVLSVVHCAEPGGTGPEYVLPTWEQTKVALQRDVLQLRQAKAASLPQKKPAVVATDALPASMPEQVPPARPTDPEPVHQLKPSHAKAKALYEWAMEHIDGAEKMTYAELFEKLTNDPRCAGEGLPNNAEAFGRYCRSAGVRRNTPRREKGATRSVRRASHL